MATPQKCAICSVPLTSAVIFKDLEPEIQTLLLNDYPQLKEQSAICFSHVMDYRLAHIKNQIKSDSDEMAKINKTVISSIQTGAPISENTNLSLNERLTAGQKTADAIARFGGSWPFIFTFIGVLIVWITINSIALFSKPFDPYPFILLNLVLSCLAAVQAPVIMMSQNRQGERDRMQTNNDYQTNLKAEIEIRLLHQKMDHLLNNEWQHLVEMQNIQLSLLEELQKQINDIPIATDQAKLKK
ncbi:DUF1003 domain-containing protein [Vagococcus sp. BWB3-3]|uniref:DUF1003 domain-containing protein n=1 Tax=Vagococcus allomyrinae TaxID=2794353 RepID=A0A940P1F8_9ENTE|nr:DUF1003 domain-containing protein [Vagococcus allomyrinae]MBP1039712.1 DUF1003 domain-containing protein [Vagococcus allomyrinae]